MLRVFGIDEGDQVLRADTLQRGSFGFEQGGKAGAGIGNTAIILNDQTRRTVFLRTRMRNRARSLGGAGRFCSRFDLGRF